MCSLLIALGRRLLAVCLLCMVFAQGAHAETILNHSNQQDVIRFLKDHKPKVLSPAHKIPFSQLLAELQDKPVIFVGEQHDHYGHHLNQLAILRGLYQQNPKIILGVEWFQQPFQAVLNDYLAGEINEDALLRQSGYYQRWRYDYRQLRPILLFAKEHQIPVIALNAPQEITSKVGQHGLEGLNADERMQLPKKIHPATGKYRDYLLEVFKQHMSGQENQRAIEHFMLVQRIWDETMAMNVVQQLQKHPQHQMIVFAGSGHLGRRALPGDVERLLPAATLATLHSAEPEAAETGEFDYLIMTDEWSLPPAGKLGVWLDEANEAVSIRKLPKDSAAAKAGLQRGDRFVRLDGKPIRSRADLFIGLKDKLRGEAVELTVKRGATGSDGEGAFQNNEQTVFQVILQ